MRDKVPSHQAVAAQHRWVDVVCFACGYEPTRVTQLERAHVVPHALGGDDSDPANYALLCKACHQEAPNVASREAMWQWIDHQQKLNDPLLRYEVIKQEGAYLEDWPDGERLAAVVAWLGAQGWSKEQWHEHLGPLVTTHWGAPGMNRATRAYALWRVLKWAEGEMAL